MKKSLSKRKSKLLDNNKEFFQELLDSFDEKGFEGIVLKGPKISPQRAENFQLLNLLEYETERLQKTDHFLNVKLPNRNDHEVMDKILDQQLGTTLRKKNELIKKFCPIHSPVSESMKKIFNQAFKKHKTAEKNAS